MVDSNTQGMVDSNIIQNGVVDSNTKGVVDSNIIQKGWLILI